MKWMAIQLALLSVAFGAAAQNSTMPKPNMELCDSAQASYRIPKPE